MSKPWELDPRLKEPSLRALASRMLEIRTTVANAHDAQAGDGAWSRGCRAYQRTVNLLTADAKKKTIPGLTVVRTNNDLSCTLLIYGVPFRFYRGEPEAPSSRHLYAGLAEQRSLGLPDVDDDWCWMIAVETDADGVGRAVTFFQASDNAGTRNAWRVEVPSRAPLTLGRAGVELPPPIVMPKSAPSKRKEGSTDNES